MTGLTESIVEEAALGWFQELGYAVLSGPLLAPGEPTAERETFSDVVLVGRRRVAIHQLKPVISLLAIPTLRDTLLTELLSRELSIAEVKNSR
jgi:type I restriction enzyme R subunit